MTHTIPVRRRTFQLRNKYAYASNNSVSMIFLSMPFGGAALILSFPVPRQIIAQAYGDGIKWSFLRGQYDSKGYFCDKPIHRYLLNSYMLKRGMLYTENGKLMIQVQHYEPTIPSSARTGCLHTRVASSSPPAPMAPLIDGSHDGSHDMLGIARVDD